MNSSLARNPSKINIVTALEKQCEKAVILYHSQSGIDHDSLQQWMENDYYLLLSYEKWIRERIK